jgi:hypothetical protein
MAVSFSEDVGLGAISKSGALPIGGDGKWLELAESKLKKDNELDYQSLLWELGSEVSERQQVRVELGLDLGLRLKLELGLY